MLKISRVGIPTRTVTLKLEGRVVGPWVQELRRSCEPLLLKQSKIALDLSEVSFVDDEGVAALNHLKSCGVELDNCSSFVEHQIKTSL
jgi:anti-anti-sigma regulatory factor